MNPQTQPIFNRAKPQPTPDPKPKLSEQRDGGDVFLQAACAARTALDFYFLDGETIRGSRIKTISKFSILLSVQENDILVFKHSLKKICAEVLP
jgi:sRNA-binding regulator protein Hfq